MPRSGGASPLRIVDLFCGAGGLSQGFVDAGFEVAFAVDWDEDSCATFRANHPAVDVECAPITELSAREIRRRSGGDVTVVTGGPSCQGFSTAGRKAGWVRPDDDRNLLWLHMLEIVKELKPRAFLMENVPGLVYWKEGHFGKEILARFRAIGYSVTSRILLAADYGVPQRRRRLFIVGVRGEENFSYPPETHLGGWRRDTLTLWEQERVRRGLLRHLTCWEAIGDLPAIGEGAGEAEMSYSKIRPTGFARRMRAGSEVLLDHEVIPLTEHLPLIKHVPPGGTWRDIPRHLLPERFRGMRRTDSTNLLARLAPELPAYTITTQFHNVTTGCVTHPYEDRSLSVREGARLQTFPDTYTFVGSLTSRCRQIGNAVPPVLAHALADRLAMFLDPGREETWQPLRPAKQLPPPSTDERTRNRLSRQRKRDTRPETLVRKELTALGMAFTVDAAPVPSLRRRADLVFESARVAVFVDGCFWHGCPDHARRTKSHTKWWADKIARNQERDAETDRRLRRAGWSIVRVWEHESPAEAAARVRARVLQRERIAG